MSFKRVFNYYAGTAIAISLILLLMSGVAAQPINSCQIINFPGNYDLSQNIYNVGNLAVSTCIKITSNDVVFDGGNNFITGNMAVPGTIGVYVHNDSKTVSNVTVKNLQVKDLNYGIYYNNTRNGTIANNTVLNNSEFSILFESSSNGTIEWNNVSLNERGIRVFSGHYNTIKYNNASHNIGSGIKLNFGSTHNNILNNIANSNKEDGIFVENFSNNNIIHNNTVILNNAAGITLKSSSNNNDITNNTLIYNGLYYDTSGRVKSGIIIRDDSNFNNAIGNRIEYNEAGIRFYSSHNNTLSRNIISNNNLSGLKLEDSNNNSISENNASKNNGSGIVLSNSSNYNRVEFNTLLSNSAAGVMLFTSSKNNLIISNNASYNKGAGIVLEDDSNRNIVKENRVKNNGKGFFIISSYNNEIIDNTVELNDDYGFNLTNSGANRIYHNNIINNIRQANDNTDANPWNDSYPSGGNYWSNYNGADNFRGTNQDQPGSDGIVDIPYTFNSNSGATDKYPLKNQNGWLPIAQFAINKNFVVGTDLDSLSKGIYNQDLNYYLDINNFDDTSDTVMGNIRFDAKADNITNVDWREYATWNKTSANWTFPTDRLIYENQGFGTGFKTNYSESRLLNVSINRWMNKTEFSTNGYQLVKFNVTFENKDFEWAWARIEANNRNEINVFIIESTFTRDATGNYNTWEHGIHFDFDKNSIQPGKVYNFSVVVKVELTGREAPPIQFKPQISIGMGMYSNSTFSQGFRAEMPAGMLPDKISYASTSSNINNTWLLNRNDHNIAQLDEVSRMVGSRAQFAINKNFVVGTESDSLSSGFYERNLNYNLDIGNFDDTSDTVMGNIRFDAKADNITNVDWREYAVWNKTSANWTFPADRLIYENEGFGTGFNTNYSESRVLNVSINRWMNKTDFSTNGYQLVKFNVTFENKDFEWAWARIEANNRNEVNVSIIESTFTKDAPGNYNTWENGIHFDFDKNSIQPGKVYNFSVVVKVDLTGREAPPIQFKPQFSVGMGTYFNSTISQGFRAEMPAGMLPDKISYASTSSNILNTWLLKRHDHNIAQLDEVSKPVGLRAQFALSKDFIAETGSNSLNSGDYQHNIRYGLNIDNIDDDSDTTLGNIRFSVKADNITNVDWRQYATWNKTSVNWTFPPEYIIRENEGFGTGFTDNRSELRSMNVNISRWMNNTAFTAEGYQLAKFNVTFKDKNFEWVWARIEANNRYGVEASIVPRTFVNENNAPGQFDVWNNGIHFNFYKERIQTGINYSFSVLVKVRPTGERKQAISYKPEFLVGEGLYQNFANGGTGTGVEVPFGMLPENIYQATASTNVSNTWLVVSQGHNIAVLGRDFTPPVITDFKVEPNTSISTGNPPVASANVSDENLAKVEFGVIDSNNLVDTNRTLLGVYINESGVNGKYVSKPWNANAAHITNGTVNETITAGINADNPELRLVFGYFKKNTTSNEEVAVLIFNKTSGILLDIKKQDNTSLQIENGISNFRSIISKFVNGITTPPVEVSGRTFTLYNLGSSNNPELILIPVPSGTYKVFVHATDTEGNDNGAMLDARVSQSGIVGPFPDIDKTPTDPDGDGLYEDINGNGRKDFNDVVLFFNYLEWIPVNQPISSFDFNGNGRIDFNDIIKLFEEL